MHIGYFSSILGTKGGPAVVDKRVIENISKCDNKNKYTVYGLTQDATKCLELAENPNINIRTIKPSGKWLGIAYGLTMELKKRPVDLLHATIIPPPFIPCKFVLTITCWSQFDQPELYHPLIRMRLLYLLRRGIKNATAILCYTEYLRNKVINEFNFAPERVLLYQPAVADEIKPIDDINKLKNFLNEAGIDFPYILFIGTLTKRKNIVGLIEAYAKLVHEEKIEQKLVLLGEQGYGFDEITDTAEKLNVSDRIRVLGRYPHSELPYFYQGADVFVFPTFSEGFGLPPLEAMACGTPVVASNVTSVPEVVGDAALLFDPNKTDEIAEAIHKCISDADLRQDLINKGFSRAGEFTWDRAAGQAISAYEKIYKAGW